MVVAIASIAIASIVGSGLGLSRALAIVAAIAVASIVRSRLSISRALAIVAYVNRGIAVVAIAGLGLGLGQSNAEKAEGNKKFHSEICLRTVAVSS